jgi:hypothetical protein
MSDGRIETAEELDALPPECLLRSTQPGYGPTYLVTFDCGDGELMFVLTSGVGVATSAEAVEESGPFVVLYRPERPFAPLTVQTGRVAAGATAEAERSAAFAEAVASVTPCTCSAQRHRAIAAEATVARVEVLAAHQRQGSHACLCGELRLGTSFAGHQVDMLTAARVLAARDEIATALAVAARDLALASPNLTPESALALLRDAATALADPDALAKAKAEAWDEAEATCQDVFVALMRDPTTPTPKNPYRAPRKDEHR